MKSKFTIFIIILTSYFLLLTSSRSAYAHVLKTDGSIGAVLHISPEDDPVAGEESSFFFEFKDKINKFRPENCECTGKVLKEGEEIYSTSLFLNTPNPSLEGASFSYTFPEKNIYKVQISGKPTTQDTFEPFTLSWDVRVEREKKEGETRNQTPSTNWFNVHTMHILLILPATIFMIYVIIKNKK